MADLRISLSHDDAPIDAAVVESLRQDLDRNIGSAEYTTDHVAGAKGLAITDVATIAISVLSSQAVLALIGILKSHLERDRSAEIEIEGENGQKIHIKASDARSMNPDAFAEILTLARSRE
jgi:hypothetical protein